MDKETDPAIDSKALSTMQSKNCRKGGMSKR